MQLVWEVPTSVAGFMAAMSLKSGCRWMAAASPRSLRVMLPAEPSNSPAMRSKACRTSGTLTHRPSNMGTSESIPAAALSEYAVRPPQARGNASHGMHGSMHIRICGAVIGADQQKRDP